MVLLRKFWNDTAGATAIEYGLIAALISVSLISGVGLFGSNLSNMFNMISGKLNNQ
jgi:pilus assembly protein Flp/PilA